MDTFKALITKWQQPIVVITLSTSIVYGIIWLVQLEDRTVRQEGRVTALEIQAEIIFKSQHDMAILISRTTAIQDVLIHQQDSMEKRMTRNESWIQGNRHGHKEIK